MPTRSLPKIRSIVRQLEPQAALANVATMDQIVANSDHATANLRAAARHLCRHRCRPGGRWPLRCDGVPRDPADAGNRHPHGARRSKTPGVVPPGSTRWWRCATVVRTLRPSYNGRMKTVPYTNGPFVVANSSASSALKADTTRCKLPRRVRRHSLRRRATSPIGGSIALFYIGMAFAVALFVFVGFAPTYYLRSRFQTAPLPLYLHSTASRSPPGSALCRADDAGGRAANRRASAARLGRSGAGRADGRRRDHGGDPFGPAGFCGGPRGRRAHVSDDAVPGDGGLRDPGRGGRLLPPPDRGTQAADAACDHQHSGRRGGPVAV